MSKDQNFNILIVDDIPTNIQVVANILKEENYEMSFAQSGADALFLVETGDFDLILLDIMMPDMDGLEVCRKIMSNPDLKHIPIIFLTAKSEIETTVSGFELGAVDYISKPFNGAELLARVKTHLKLKSITESLSDEIEVRSKVEKELRQKSLELEKINQELFERVEEETQKRVKQERLLVEELKKHDRLKDEFLANTSHELRTPLHGMIGLAESLLEQVDPDNHELKLSLSMIYSSGKRLNSLINDLLDFSRIKNGELKLELKPVSLSLIAEIVTSISKPLAAKKNLVLINSVSKELPAVIADENRLQQVLFNLLSNSIKFTQIGNIELSAQLVEKEIKISVCDTGIGIAAGKQQAIFDPFKQLDGTVSRKESGIGIGLAITKKLIELQNGKIDLQSIEGVGSKFFFNLPTTEEIPKKSRLTSIVPQIENFYSAPVEDKINDTIKGTKILLVDDDSLNLKILNNHLGRRYSLVNADNGFDALELLEEDQQIGLVVLDIMMPGMSGYEVCRTIRKSYPNRNLGIILLTAKNQEADLVVGFQSGANDYLTKPFLKEELLSRVEAQLKQRETLIKIKENLELKEEIEQRKKLEQKLEAAKRQMLRILDLSEYAIITFNAENKITFFNLKAEELFGFQNSKIISEPIQTIFPEFKKGNAIFDNFVDQKTLKLDQNSEIKLTAISVNQNQQEVRLKIKTFELKNETFFALFIEEKQLFTVTKQGLDSYQKLSQLESSVQNLVEYLTGGNQKIIEEIRSSPSSLDKLENNIEELPGDDKVRELLVDLMNLSVRYWEITTLKNKIDLANDSMIWTVSSSEGSFRVRTMERYMNISSLPKKIRWRDVMRTANYVLENCPEKTEQKHELTEKKQYLERILLQREAAKIK